MIVNRVMHKLDGLLFGGVARDIYASYRHRLPSNKFDVENEYSYIVHYTKSENNELAALCDRHGSDKGSIKKTGHAYTWPPHTYADFYSRLFDHCRPYVRRVFECGLGTNNTSIRSNMGANAKPGASLRVWRDYFAAADIYGVDIDPAILFQEDRIKTFCVDQTDPRSIEAFWTAVGVKDFDLMIDDGLHTFEAGACLFENSIAKLSKTGIYIIEDVRFVEINKYRRFFATREYNVDFVNLLRPGLKNTGNSVVVIRLNQRP